MSVGNIVVVIEVVTVCGCAPIEERLQGTTDREVVVQLNSSRGTPPYLWTARWLSLLLSGKESTAQQQ